MNGATTAQAAGRSLSLLSPESVFGPRVWSAARVRAGMVERQVLHFTDFRPSPSPRLADVLIEALDRGN
jgi:hypothetical protein